MGVFRALGMAARRWYLLVPLVLVAVGVAWLTYRSMPARYTATAVYQVNVSATSSTAGGTDTDSGSGAGSVTPAPPAVAAQLVRAVAPPGRQAQPYRVTARPGSALITVRAMGDSPSAALETINSVDQRLRAQLASGHIDASVAGQLTLAATVPASVGPPARGTGIKVFLATLLFGVLLAVVIAAWVERSAERRRALLVEEVDGGDDADEVTGDDTGDAAGTDVSARAGGGDSPEATGGEPPDAVDPSEVTGRIDPTEVTGRIDPSEVTARIDANEPRGREHGQADRRPAGSAPARPPAAPAPAAPVSAAPASTVDDADAPTDVAGMPPVRDEPSAPPDRADRRLGAPVRQLAAPAPAAGRSVGPGASGELRPVPPGGPASRAAAAAMGAAVAAARSGSAAPSAPAPDRPGPAAGPARPRGSGLGGVPGSSSGAGVADGTAVARVPNDAAGPSVADRPTSAAKPGAPSGAGGADGPVPPERPAAVGGPGAPPPGAPDGPVSPKRPPVGEPTSGRGVARQASGGSLSGSDLFADRSTQAGEFRPLPLAPPPLELPLPPPPPPAAPRAVEPEADLGSADQLSVPRAEPPAGELDREVDAALGYHPPRVNPFGADRSSTFDSSALWAPAGSAASGSGGFPPATPLPAGDRAAVERAEASVSSLGTPSGEGGDGRLLGDLFAAPPAPATRSGEPDYLDPNYPIDTEIDSGIDREIDSGTDSAADTGVDTGGSDAGGIDAEPEHGVLDYPDRADAEPEHSEPEYAEPEYAEAEYPDHPEPKASAEPAAAVEADDEFGWPDFDESDDEAVPAADAGHEQPAGHSGARSDRSGHSDADQASRSWETAGH